MNRRNFLGGAVASGLATGPAAGKQTANQYMELCFYQLRNDSRNQRRRLTAFLKDAHLPMTRRLGIGPVGYFEVYLGPETPRVVTVAAYDSLGDLQAKQAAQRSDKEWMRASEAVSESGEAVFQRVETWLLRAFDGMPKLAAPPLEKGKPPRFFDLRTYESASFSDRRRKIDMFNSGEIEIFRRCGLHPVFFGETLFGGKIPNITYMVWYDDWDAREAAWAKFRQDPEWKRISKDPRWAGAVCNITNTFLQPLAFSPIR